MASEDSGPYSWKAKVAGSQLFCAVISFVGTGRAEQAQEGALHP